VHGIDDVLNEVTDAARNINEETEQPQDQRDEYRTAKDTANTKKYAPNEIDEVYFFFTAVKIVKKVFYNRFPCAVFIISFQSRYSFLYHALIIA